MRGATCTEARGSVAPEAATQQKRRCALRRVHTTNLTSQESTVAKIVPAQAREWDRSAVLDEAEAFRKTVKIKGSVNLRELMEHGRR